MAPSIKKNGIRRAERSEQANYSYGADGCSVLAGQLLGVPLCRICIVLPVPAKVCFLGFEVDGWMDG
jgi:hypothetical protein